MALIKCPECGKEISDKAKNCIHCGYPIQDLKYETHGEPCAYYDTFFRSDKLIFDKGLSNGTKGKCSGRDGIWDYCVNNNQLYIDEKKSEIYLINDKLLLKQSGEFNGYIPNDDIFSTTCSYHYENNNITKTISFYSNSKANVSYTTPANISSEYLYVRNGDFILLYDVLLLDYDEADSPIYVVFKNKLYEFSYIEEKEVSGLNELLRYHKRKLLEATYGDDNLYENGLQINNVSSTQVHSVECPYCKSSNCTKISGLSKAGSVALWGVFALGKTTKQWHCNNCKSDF